MALGVAGCAREESALATAPAKTEFKVEEATIAGIHAAIESGQTTCQGVVEAYLKRARAYNGVCTALITKDGEDIAAATGYVRAGAPLAFPTKTTSRRRRSSPISINTRACRSTTAAWSRRSPTRA